jgi:hypothetical protein
MFPVHQFYEVSEKLFAIKVGLNNEHIIGSHRIILQREYHKSFRRIYFLWFCKYYSTIKNDEALF